MHQDFNVLPTSYRSEYQMRRVMNLILFLNEVEGGDLIIGNDRVRPKPGRLVCFDPSVVVHGHPTPLESEHRTSIAVYLYRREKIPESEWRGTRYYCDAPPEKIRERADPKIRYAKWYPKE